MDEFLDAVANSSIACKWVNDIVNVTQRCEFVMDTDSCDYDGFIYNYIVLTYCQLSFSKWLAIFVLAIIAILLFFSIGILADDFLCPSLLTVSKTLRLPDNIAGVTLLAFGNGAPDIFASASGIHHAMPELIFSSLYGAGIFVTTVVTGSILLIADFQMIKRPLIRDITFYIGAASLVWFFIHTNKLTLYHSIILICYYLTFIVTIGVSRLIYVRYGQKTPVSTPKISTPPPRPRILLERENTVNIQEEFEAYGSPTKSNRSSIVTIAESISHQTISSESSESNVSSSQEILDNRKRTPASVIGEGDVILTKFHRSGTLSSSRSRSRSLASYYPRLAHHHWSNTLHRLSRSNLEDTYSRKSSNVSVMNHRPEYNTQTSRVMEFVGESKNFLFHICPVDLFEWNSYSRFKKTKEIIKAIPYFILTICIPVVDLESINENWCRLLICVNLIMAPQAIMFIENVDQDALVPYIRLEIWSVTLIVSVVLAILVLLTSSSDKPPRYHRIFAFIGFGISVAFIDALAGEVVELLNTVGIILNASESILGLTVLAWGNSLGDFISNLSMARHGYPGMAIAACFGGPMLNLLMGLGVPYLILFLSNDEDNDNDAVQINYCNTLTLLNVTLLTSLVFSLVIFLLNRFKSSKIHGIILIGIYLCYLVLAILIELKIIPNNTITSSS